jgi:hypothetical protein
MKDVYGIRRNYLDIQFKGAAFTIPSSEALMWHKSSAVLSYVKCGFLIQFHGYRLREVVDALPIMMIRDKVEQGETVSKGRWCHCVSGGAL